MKAFFSHVHHNKAGLTVFSLLATATAFCFVLVSIRMAENGDSKYAYWFLIRNLSLAWIPFLISFVAYHLALPRKLSLAIFPVIIFFWLIFFPNALYLLTDYQHLRLYADSPSLWFDVIMLTWFAWTGILLGVVSLYWMQEITRQRFNQAAGWAFVICGSLLGSMGIYLGRFSRVNSWDLLREPLAVIKDLMAPRSGEHPVKYIALYTLFFTFMYTTFYVFGKLLQKQPPSGEKPGGTDI
jgi:uncharacterized membrane protein